MRVELAQLPVKRKPVAWNTVDFRIPGSSEAAVDKSVENFTSGSSEILMTEVHSSQACGSSS
jgi:hypothetical protein